MYFIKLLIDGEPCEVELSLDDIYIKTDEAGNIKPDKAKSTEKIDGVVATVMALDRVIRCGNESPESVYDSRGLLFA